MWKRERSERSALDDMMAESAKSYSPTYTPPAAPAARGYAAIAAVPPPPPVTGCRSVAGPLRGQRAAGSQGLGARAVATLQGRPRRRRGPGRPGSDRRIDPAHPQPDDWRAGPRCRAMSRRAASRSRARSTATSMRSTASSLRARRDRPWQRLRQQGLGRRRRAASAVAIDMDKAPTVPNVTGRPAGSAEAAGEHTDLTDQQVGELLAKA